jgi:hypothetical protein
MDVKGGYHRIQALGHAVRVSVSMESRGSRGVRCGNRPMQYVKTNTAIEMKGFDKHYMQEDSMVHSKSMSLVPNHPRDNALR